MSLMSSVIKPLLTMPVLSELQLVTFRGGFVADWTVVRRLLELESRGATFRLEDGGRFRIIPPSLLTDDDIAFLRAHRDEARRVLEYQADDSHLFRDDASAKESLEDARK
jgi:hypothetical protein